MKKQIIHFSIYQSSKVLSILASIYIAIIAFPLALILLLSDHVKEGIVLILYPFIFSILFFIGHAIVFALYNFVARHFGGVEFTVKDLE